MLLLPWRYEGSFLREQVDDLTRAPSVTILEPGRLPLSSLGRLPAGLARAVAGIGARTVRLPADARVFVIFHPWQLPFARALIARFPGSELWYSQWDRYEAAFSHRYYNEPRLRRRLLRLHEAAAAQAALIFGASTRLAELEREAGRAAAVVPFSADTFPAPDPTRALIAVSLGHLGRRTDWSLLRDLAERLPELVVLLIGSWNEVENKEDGDFRVCRSLPNLVWLGHRSDEEAARLIQCADVGLVLYRTDDYNDAALPHRILKYARQGRYSLVPDIAGARTWERALIVCRNVDEWTAALRAHAGARHQPDMALRAWALEQTAEVYNKPLWDRLAVLGIHADGSHDH